MIKLVVLCAFFAAAAAEPSAPQIYGAPVTTYSSVLSPAPAFYSQPASSVVYSSLLGYSTPVAYPYSHFIKKRSAPVYGYPYSYYASNAYAAPAAPLVASTYSTSYINSAPLISHAPAVHLIKKRSAPLLASTYSYYGNGPYATAALPYSTTSVSSYSLASPYYSSAAVIPSAPVHFIKKRSAPLLPTTYYSAPYSQAASVPLSYSTPLINSPFFSQPIASYASFPAGYTPLIK